MSSVLQVYPSRISITPKREPLEFHKVKFNKQCHSYTPVQEAQFLKNFKIVNNPFILSKASKRKLFDSINSMYALSPKRLKVMQNGKSIYNFKLSFITLTLPSKQMHSDIQIKKDCLNQLLIELKKHYKTENFVWKAELQANKNIHFHLILDQYVDFQALRRRWNRIINKLGYVDVYRQKMSLLSLSEYHQMRNKSGNVEFNSSVKAYAKGCRSNWSNPNSVDVRSVSSKKDLASYLAKYVTKQVSKEEASDELTDRQIAFGRSWSRSYSLVKLKYQNKYLANEMKTLINYLDSIPDVVKKFTGDFFTVYYFQVSKLSKSFQQFHNRFMLNNARLWGYPIPI